MKKGYQKCPVCQDGQVYSDEDGRRVSDTCYKCHGTAEIPDEAFFLDRLAGAIERVAAVATSKLKKQMESDPHGEGWTFRAAENGMSGMELFAIRQEEMGRRLDRAIRELHVTDRLLVEALVDIINPLDESAPEPQEAPWEDPVPGDEPAGDLPF